MKTPSGFTQEKRRIYFMGPKGKDISVQRWRICLYYAPNFALTHFADSQKAYDTFLANHQPSCFADYETFHDHYWASALNTNEVTA